MYRNKTAWFSSSVPQARQKFWLSESGTVASWREADYLFSNDAACPDTLRIFESTYFLWNNVTVFHSLFLSACEKRMSVRSVPIGHYVLPPAPVQEEVRKVMGRFIWECEDNLDSYTSCLQAEDGSSDDELASDIFQISSIEAPEYEEAEGSDFDDPASCMSTEYVEMSSLPKYTGALRELSPASIHCSCSEGPVQTGR
ncbi:telomere repeats-binding bouquet formation protein 2 [Synchiropus splendidus]|uniref:telomere repeats-binding bouquet formation protein 2 n=1 Tax=Synchiropus splendidus TaxID=270530 RepID=UPI00237D38A8|nr:telomere repeats-binding bouquet formation protein 2 [Synchiropus splendidus]